MAKFSTITGSLGNINDRYMSCGYKDDCSYEELITNLCQQNVLNGVELCFNSEGGIESEKDKIIPLLQKYGIEASFVNSSLFGERKWSKGSLSSSSAEVRNEAISDCKRAIDFTREIKAEGFNLWTGQDGFDYPLQVDYARQWDDFLTSLRTLCEYAPDVNITLEPKLREPRNRSLVDTVPTALLACAEVGCPNLGLTVDVGHTLQAGGNMARDLEMAAKSERLFNIHINDNYGVWDDDMIAGSVRMIEYIEMMYSLQKYNYTGWISVDIFPYRENQYEAVRESILYMQCFDQVVDKIGKDSLSALITRDNPTEMLKTIREAVFTNK